MTEMPDLGKALFEKINKLFRSKKARRAVYQLMYWNEYPTKSDRIKLGEEVGLAENTIKNIVYKLVRNKLFEKERGSIPLYNARHGVGAVEPREEAEERGEIPLTEETERMLRGEPTEEIEEIKGVSEPPIGAVQERTKFPAPTVLPTEKPDLGAEKAALERGLTLDYMEAQMTAMREDMGRFTAEIRATVKGLSAPNPTEISSPTTDPIQEVVEAPSPSPLAGLTGDQVIELARNQPQQFLELVNPRAPRTVEGDRLESYVEAPPETVRKMIVEVTTYTQMLYEKAKADGGFDGTFSDFLNWAPAKYFEDRGLALGWHRVESAHRRRLG